MESTVHKNYKLAAYLIFASVAVDLWSAYIQYQQNAEADITRNVEIALLFLTLGYFTIIGKDWIKWIILVVTILTVFPLLAVKEEAVNLYYYSQLFSGFLKVTSFTFLLLLPKHSAK